MKKLISTIILALAMVLACVSLTAYGGGEGEGSESLSDILSRAKGIASVKYDVVITSPEQPTMTQKVWQKGKKMRMEATVQGQLVVILTDGEAQTVYVYSPSQNMAMQMDYSQAPKSVAERMEPLEGATVIGKETIDGKICTVVEYTSEGATVKAWIWEKHGFPIRIEATTPQGKVIVEFKNIEFIDIPNGMFELPPGAEIMKMP